VFKTVPSKYERFLNKAQILIIMIPVVLFSLTVHEYSHGKVAFLLGDDTAKRLGRLSFNPLKHLDFFGVISFYFIGFGWAKPVPVDPRNFRNLHRDMMYVALAGPLSNVALAVVFSFVIRVMEPYDSPVVFTLLALGIFINTSLAIFNLLPIFPLDGSSILKGLLPQRIAENLANLDRFGAFLLLGVILLDQFAHTGILGTLMGKPLTYAVEFFTQEQFSNVVQIIQMSFSAL